VRNVVDTLLRDMADCATVSMAMLPESPWLFEKLLSIGVAVQFNAGEIGQHAGPLTAYEYPDALLVKSSIHEDMALEFLSREQMHASAMKHDGSSRGGTSRGGGGKRTRGGTSRGGTTCGGGTKRTGGGASGGGKSPIKAACGGGGGGGDGSEDDSEDGDDDDEDVDSDNFVDTSFKTVDYEHPEIKLCYQPDSLAALKAVVVMAPGADGIKFTKTTSENKLFLYDASLGYVSIDDDFEMEDSAVNRIVDFVQNKILTTPVSVPDWKAAGKKVLTRVQRDKACDKVTAKKVHSALHASMRHDKRIELDQHGGVCNLRGRQVIELGVDGRPRLIDRTQGHLCTFHAGGGAIWLRDELGQGDLISR